MKGVYLDGAWGQNPPLNDLIGLLLDEIWLVEVYPQRRSELPRSREERRDRKEELWHTALVEQERYIIDKINEFLDDDRGLVTDAFRALYHRIEVRKMPMLRDLPASVSTVNSRSLLEDMMDEGERDARDFLEALEEH